MRFPASRPVRPAPRIVSILAIVLLQSLAAAARADDTAATSAALLGKHVELQPSLKDNQFRAPIHLVSTQTENRLEGDLYAELDYPFAALGSALKSGSKVCEILFLHLNVKSCRTAGTSARTTLTIYVGGKSEPSLDAASRMDYLYKVAAERPDYLQVLLTAESGPLGTSDYRISLEVVPLDEKRCFVRLTYAYGFGMMAKLAMGAYLKTAGRSKVGFSVIDKTPEGRPVHVDGLRGAVERNVMRYYLALVAYLGASASPAQEQPERRLRDWFALTERHALQLHELTLDEYLDEKHREASGQPAAAK